MSGLRACGQLRPICEHLAAMELGEAIKTLGTCRRFIDAEVPEAALWRAVDAARFGPQGGNRQPVRFVVVRDPVSKRRLGELYTARWDEYIAARRAPGRGERSERSRRRVEEVDAFARAFGSHPAIVVVCAHLPSLVITDARLNRPSVVGGASIYPTVQNFLLSLRAQGIGSAITTLLCADEPAVKELLSIPADYATACHIVVGYPAKPFPRRLSRRPVEEIAFLERFGGPPPRAP